MHEFTFINSLCNFGYPFDIYVYNFNYLTEKILLVFFALFCVYFHIPCVFCVHHVLEVRVSNLQQKI